ncbi:MAG: PAS domain S-box protein [Spirochaetales bacterium]|nr:PAS domain S-box protein [Spirochaetales bacterium]
MSSKKDSIINKKQLVMGRLWRFITKTVVPESESRNFLNSQLLAFLLVLFFLSFLVIALVKSSVYDHYFCPWFVYIVLIFSFICNRFWSYRVAAIITNFMLPFILFLKLLWWPDLFSIQSLFFIIPAIILASLLLDQIEYIIYSVFILVFLGLLSFTGLIPLEIHEAFTDPAVICFFTIVFSQLLRSQLSAVQRHTISSVEASQSRFRDLVETTSDWIWEVNADGRFVYSSPQAKDILGYETHEILGKRPTSFMKFEDAKQIRSFFESLRFTKEPISHLRSVSIHKNGSEVILESSGMPILGDNNLFMGYRGINRDITEKFRIEHKLIESEKRYRMFINNFQGIAYEQDFESGTLSLFDGAVKSISSYPRIQFLSGEKKWKDMIFSEDKELYEEEGRKLSQLSGYMANYEYRIVLPDSSIRWIREICKVSNDPITHKKLLQGVMFDISESKFLQEKIRQTEKIEAIGLLAGGIAHDFNNQLAGIVGCSDLLRLHLQDNPELSDLIEAILLSARRATDLTNQLLAYARKGKFQSVAVDIHDVIKEVCKLLEHTIDKKIQIVQEFEAFSADTMGDPSQIQNALLNISLNARDAMAEGGVLIFQTEIFYLDEAFCHASSFDIQPGNFVKITIRDNGVGMSEDVMARIFEPFFTTKEQGKGTGMGLSAVYGTIKNHKGAIEVESLIGHGSSFTIYLPLVKSPSKPIVPIKVNTSIQFCQECCILVVDDEPSVLKMIRLMLVKLGHRVYVANNGREAIDIFVKDTKAIDFIILDMIMPVKDGKQTFRALKKIDPSVRVLLSSGYSINEEAQTLLEEGALGFIQKPFNLEQIQKKIQSILSQSN